MRVSPSPLAGVPDAYPSAADPTRRPAASLRGPRFGCRNLFMAASQPLRLRDVWRLMMSPGGWSNAFRDQVSCPRPALQQRPETDFWNPATEPSAGKGNADGFGWVALGRPWRLGQSLNRALWTVRKPFSAQQDWAFPLRLLGTLLRRPTMLAAHLRHKTDRDPLSTQNTHPFCLTIPVAGQSQPLRLHLIHNGMTNAFSVDADLAQALAELPRESPGLHPAQPQGTGDSERVLYLVAQRLRQGLKQPAGATITAEQLTPSALTQAVRDTLDTLLARSTREPWYKPHWPKTALNLMLLADLPDGRRVAVLTRLGQSLYKTWLSSASGQRTFVVASEKMHPPGQTHPWVPVPEGGIITVVQSRKGETTVSESSVNLT